MTELDKPEQTAVNDSGTDAGADTQLTRIRFPNVRGWTYFVRRANGHIKIGFSDRPDRRIRQLSREFGKLEALAIVPAAMAGEFETHQRFDRLRVEGEWFEPADDLMAFIGIVKAEWDNAAPAPRTPQQIEYDNLARSLIRKRPSLPKHKQHIVSNIVEILWNLETYKRPEWAIHESQTLPGKLKQQMAMLAAA